MTIILAEKRCTQCGIVKSSSEFHKRSNGTKLQPKCKMCRKRGKPNPVIGLTKICINCKNEYPRIREYFWSAKSNIDGLSVRCIPCDKVDAAIYYQEHKEDCNRRSIDWQKRRSKKWRDSHRESTRMYTAERRARLRNAEGYHTADDIKKQHKSQKGLCWWCSNPLGDRWELDHLTPLNRGGTNWPNNIVCSCRKCNASRQDKMPHEWSNRLL